MGKDSQGLSASDAARIRDHMNAEHADDLLRYARVFGETPGATSARMTGIDAEGLDLEVQRAETTVSLRIPFDTSVDGPDEARRMLVDMALRARETAG